MRLRALLIRALLCLLAVCTLCSAIPVAGQATSLEKTTPVASKPPVTAILPESGEQISVVSSRGKHYLYLPGGTELSALTLQYTGDKQLCVSAEHVLSGGETAEFDLSAGEAQLKEYNAATDSYLLYSLRVMTGSAIPRLYISLDNNAPTGIDDVLSWLHEEKERSTTGTMCMVDGEGHVVYDGILDTFKGRGNSSFFSPGFARDKRSYNIKLATKAELLPGAGEMKKWALIHMRVTNDYAYDYDYDLTGLSHLLGYSTYASLLGDGYYGNEAGYVDLYLDGVYRGTYLLTERVDINAAVEITDQEDFVTADSLRTVRVTDRDDPVIGNGIRFYQYAADAQKKQEFDLSGGYLLEVCGNDLKVGGFYTERGMGFELKAPERCTKEQVQYIAGFVQDFEDALFAASGYNDAGKHYSEYADLQSLASMILTYSYYQNWELFRTSTFLYIDTADSDHPKLTFGPVWDFETGTATLREDETLFGKHNTYTTRSQYLWLEPLWQKGDFMALATEKAKELGRIADSLNGRADPIPEIPTAKELVVGVSDSMAMNWVRWDYERAIGASAEYRGLQTTFDACAERHIEALQARSDSWDKLWSEKYLTGLTVAKEQQDGKAVLRANPIGTASSYQWYRLNEEGNGMSVDDATEAEFVPVEPGDYFCLATGENNAYYSGAQGQVFSSRELVLRSAPVTVGVPDETEQADGGFPWGIIVGGGLAALISGGAFALFAKKRKA